MIYIRSIIYFLGQLLSSVIVFFVASLFFFSRRKRHKVISVWAIFNVWTLKIVCNLDYRIHGLDNISPQPSVILCNHQSAWETLFLQKLYTNPAFVLKKSLLFIPIFGWGLALHNPIAINRAKKTKALNSLIKQGISRLNAGRSVIIFPEGTRQPVNDLGAFQSGGAMMAKKSNSSITPIAHNAGLFWPKNSFVKYPGVIDIHIGSAISIENKKLQQVSDEARNWIGEKLATLPNAR